MSKFDSSSLETLNDISVSGGSAVLSNVTETGFQPKYMNTRYVKPGSLKFTSVYESDVKAKKVDELFNKTDKKNIIPKKDILLADAGSTGCGVIGNGELDGTAIFKNTPAAVGTPRKESIVPKSTTGGGGSSESEDKRDALLPVGRWILTVIALCIPVVNIIMLLVWAFGRGNRARQNLSRALLILLLVFGGAVAAVLYFIGVKEVVDFFNGLIQDYHVKEFINEHIL